MHHRTQITLDRGDCTLGYNYNVSLMTLSKALAVQPCLYTLKEPK
jgi:hypothetical protein